MSGALRRDVLFALVLVAFGVYRKTAGLGGEAFAVGGMVIGAAATLVSLAWFTLPGGDGNRTAG